METTRQPDLTLPQLLQMLSRRLSLIFATTCITVLCGLALCLLSTRRYEAVGTIQVDKDSSDDLNRDTLTGAAATQSDPLAADITIHTQAKVLQSDTLALRTINFLKLNQASQTNTFFSAALSAVRGSTAQRPAEQQAMLLKNFHKNLSVTPLAGTRIIELAYTDPKPELAADVVNSLVKELVEYTFDNRYNATKAASESLSKQLDELRAKSETLQAQVAAMQKDSGIYGVGMVDAQGRQQAYSAVLDQFQKATAIMTDAEQNRLLKESIYTAALNGNAELLSSLAGNTVAGSAPSGITNSLTAIQGLRSQSAVLQGQLDQLKIKFSSGYPKVAELQSNLDALQNATQDEIARVAKRAENDYVVADKTWKDAQRRYNESKANADALNNKTVKYMLARQEADESRALYEDLLKRLKAAAVLQELKSNTVTIVDRARVPSRPKTPNIPFYLAAALAIGIITGGIAALFAEVLDDSVLDVVQIEERQLVLISVLPRSKFSNPGLEIVSQPLSRYSDAVRTTRSSLVRLIDNQIPKVILISGVTPTTPTATLSLNLAASAVQPGKTVLFVDANMRPRKLANTSKGLTTAGGLGFVLSNPAATDAIVPYPGLTGLFVLSSGPSVPNPSALLESQTMIDLLKQWRHDFDLIVIDSPSVLTAVDGVLLNQMSDATIQVAEWGITTLTSLTRVRDRLTARAGGRVYVALSEVNERSALYRNYYGFSE